MVSKDTQIPDITEAEVRMIFSGNVCFFGTSEGVCFLAEQQGHPVDIPARDN
jgi:hypothetical protein